ncbi:LysR family transcriptional regulator [Levilactobacillus acidifarinae]|uniref:Malolactic fermentation system transcription activator n=1 Tax=Levilactobacillus acidifarinae DSM 19394 = JCM 15949 TaxID=1423715 RepID=A0A0R1LDQ9_9LACO|nr:LysR family transcriptional regulator [Levilactobacillus acidifarinae]KRK93915.1 malolactic fermentation system transcription activator [Levilactobacillus acidifarinae DSM 19394]GEO68803.1 LysR family transcriptional regulator [Levilactobacillus acidifarinae]
MNTKDLAYFYQLIQQKSFSKVADYFHVTQPTITMALKRLETDYGTKLIQRDRVHNQLTVTATGQQLLTHAESILNELTVARQEITRLTQQQTVLALPPIIETHYFPQIAAQLQAHGMLANIRTIEGGSVTLRRALRNGEADIALLGSTAPLSYQKLLAKEFDRQPFAIFVSRQHPLATRQRVTFSELRHEHFILFTADFVHNTAFNQLSRRNHFRPDVVYRANDTHVIMNLVAANVGITFLTSIVDQPRNDVVRLDLLDDEPPEFIASIVYQTTHVLTPAQQQVLTVLTQALRR